jgi:hypothetical protein
MTPHTRFSTLARAVAEGAQPSDLLVELHREVAAALRASASVILQIGHSGHHSATSGIGVELSDGSWLSPEQAERLESTVGNAPRLCDGSELGSLAARLGADRALVVSLKGPGPAAFLIVAAPKVPAPEALEIGGTAGVEFVLAL